MRYLCFTCTPALTVSLVLGSANGLVEAVSSYLSYIVPKFQENPLILLSTTMLSISPALTEMRELRVLLIIFSLPLIVPNAPSARNCARLNLALARAAIVPSISRRPGAPADSG